MISEPRDTSLDFSLPVAYSYAHTPAGYFCLLLLRYSHGSTFSNNSALPLFDQVLSTPTHTLRYKYCRVREGWVHSLSLLTICTSTTTCSLLDYLLTATVPSAASCCLLPTAYCLLPTVYCLLPTSYCRLTQEYVLVLVPDKVRTQRVLYRTLLVQEELYEVHRGTELDRARPDYQHQHNLLVQYSK